MNSTLRGVENFLVAKTGTALYNKTAAANTHINTINGGVVLANGQLGVFSNSLVGTPVNTALVTATNSVQKTPQIYIAQGTGNVQPFNRYPLTMKPFMIGEINGKHEINATYTPYKKPTFSVHTLGGTATFIDTYTNYEMVLSLGGPHMQEMHNQQGYYFTSMYTTPSALPAFPQDLVWQNLGYQVATNSTATASPNISFRGRIPVVALGIKSTGGTGTAISALTANTPVNVVVIKNITKQVTFTQDQVDSLKASAIASYPSATIEVINIATAGTANKIDGLMFIALDRVLTWEDFVPNTKIHIDGVYLTQGFLPNVYSKQTSLPTEGSSTRMHHLKFRNTQQQRMYNLHVDERQEMVYPNPVDLNEKYVCFDFTHTEVENKNLNNVVVSPKATTILIPATETVLITDVTTFMNTWLGTGNHSSIVTY